VKSQNKSGGHEVLVSPIRILGSKIQLWNSENQGEASAEVAMLQVRIRARVAQTRAYRLIVEAWP